MKTRRVALVPTLASVLCLVLGCSPAETTGKTAAPPREDVQHGLGALGVAPTAADPHAGLASAPAPASGMLSGQVLESMDSGGYTYVRVDLGTGREAWAATTQFAVKVGDRVAFPGAMPMSNYTSPTLGRTFDVVYFADRIDVLGAGGGSPSAATAQPGAGHATAPSGATAPVTPLEGGKTVAQVFAEKAALAGTEVALRGRVVKFNGGIMGRNWLHLKDGTGAPGSDDLTVTTNDSVAVGDVVVVRGTLALSRDFGAGYSYDVILEQASISVD